MAIQLKNECRVFLNAISLYKHSRMITTKVWVIARTIEFPAPQMKKNGDCYSPIFEGHVSLDLHEFLLNIHCTICEVFIPWISGGADFLILWCNTCFSHSSYFQDPLRSKVLSSPMGANQGWRHLLGTITNHDVIIRLVRCEKMSWCCTYSISVLLNSTAADAPLEPRQPSVGGISVLVCAI